jgi:hypothetical protein
MRPLRANWVLADLEGVSLAVVVTMYDNRVGPQLSFCAISGDDGASLHSTGGADTASSQAIADFANYYGSVSRTR